ncbi:unnamed protein product [Parajaminaea phylloscopi]
MDPVGRVKAHLSAASIPLPDDGTLEALLAVSGGDARTAARMIIDDYRASHPSTSPASSSAADAHALRRRRQRGRLEFAENEDEYEALVRQDDRPAPRSRPRAHGSEGSDVFSLLYGALSLPFSLLHSLLVGIARIIRLPGLLATLFPWFRGAPTYNDEEERNAPQASVQFLQELMDAKKLAVQADADEDADRETQSVSTPSSIAPVFEGTYNSALQAAKNDLKVLVVMLTSGAKTDEDAKALRSFASESVTSFLSEGRFIVWGASQRRQEGRAVSRQMGLSKFPSVACVALRPVNRRGRLATSSLTGTSPQLVLISRVAGAALESPSLFKDHLEDSLSRCSSYLDGLQAERIARETERRLMEEQDKAYQEASQRDAERVSQKRAELQRQRDEESARRQMERLQQQEAQKKLAWKRWVRSHVLPTTEGQPGSEGAHISAVLPNGRRIARTFHAKAPAEHLYMWIEASTLDSEHGGGEDEDEDEDKDDVSGAKPEDYTHEYCFDIFFGYPRQRLGPDDVVGGKLRLCDIANLCPRANIIVEGVLDAGTCDSDSSSDESDT